MIRNDLNQKIFIQKESISLETDLKDLIIDFLNIKNRDYYMLLKGIRKKYFIICQKCNRYKAMEVHHLDKNRKNNKLENLIMLCKNCHHQIHNLSRRVIVPLDRSIFIQKEEGDEKYLIDTNMMIPKYNPLFNKWRFCKNCEKIENIEEKYNLCNLCYYKKINEVK